MTTGKKTSKASGKTAASPSAKNRQPPVLAVRVVTDGVQAPDGTLVGKPQAATTTLDGETLQAWLVGRQQVCGLSAGETGRAEAEAAILQWYAALDTEPGDVLACGEFVLVMTAGLPPAVSRVAVRLQPIAALTVKKPKHRRPPDE